MVAINAHFDGKVIVPDEPLELAPNQRVRIRVETVEDEAASDQAASDEARARRAAAFDAILGIAWEPNHKPHDPGADEDALWEKGYLTPRDGR